VAALVEAMFIAEVKNMLLTAGHDLDAVQLPITLDVSKGDGRYILSLDLSLNLNLVEILKVLGQTIY
jgi:hypothetical protein